MTCVLRIVICELLIINVLRLLIIFEIEGFFNRKYKIYLMKLFYLSLPSTRFVLRLFQNEFVYLQKLFLISSLRGVDLS